MNAPGRHIVVTGGAGFIGSHLVEALLAEGEQVNVFDDFSTGRRSNLDAVLDHPNLRVIEGSVLDAALVNEVVASCTAVFHLAAAVGVQLVLDRPLDSFLVNIEGTHRVLEAAERHGARVLIASTSEVFGRNTNVPLHEGSDRVLGPVATTRWWYSLAKNVDEVLAAGYARERDVDASVVRLFNTVGPRQVGRYGMVVPRLVAQARSNEPLTVYGDGTQRRTFCHVLDTVDALMRLYRDPLEPGSAVNIGGTREISIGELAELIVRVMNSSSPISYVPYAQAYPAGFEDLQRRLPDTAAIREHTGWEPSRSMTCIIEDVCRHQLADGRRNTPQEAG